ncbi:unnamed protein product [Cyprideis torosa]|uniref:Uncharacterized protein n=1 Tax=Cyprideis torosa TaxID=163714 RepID=A0A7R8W401_9CRUS|nr:unnamed protein product [Cyprideis torosa]CAG0881426.1 unnamed protein product [Cyprideis torosa]
MPDLKVAEQKFNALRQELDELGYRHTLPLEAVPLVRRVFDDLIHTTESLRKWRDKATDFEKELMVLRKAVEPYQRENGELLHVNAEHHLELLQLREHEAKKQAGTSLVTLRETGRS